MRGVNKVIIIGHLGNDPESRQFSNGGSVTNISVATSEQWTDKQTGEKREATEWHRVSLFNRLGEIAAQYLRKGSQVYIEGSLRTRKWQDQNGQDRYTTEIRADQMQMLGGASGGAQAGGYAQSAPPQQGNTDFGNTSNQAQVGFQGNNQTSQGGNGFAQNNPMQNNQTQQNSFNNQTSASPAPMKDTPRDDDIPF